jgi:hypothetical protein
MDTSNPGATPDQLAIQRYRYLLRTAPPESIEAAHREAFEQLSPEQRRQVLAGLAAQVDSAEVQATDDSPAGLARLATRAELRHPGTMERAFGGGSPGGGFGGGFLGMLAGAFVGTTIANAMFAGDVAASDLGAEGAEGGDGGVGAGDAGGNVEGGEWGDGGDVPGWDGGGFHDGGGFDLGF